MQKPQITRKSKPKNRKTKIGAKKATKNQPSDYDEEYSEPTFEDRDSDLYTASEHCRVDSDTT